ncbi:glycoside hydrolase [Dechloromonas sp. XY25]|uniref:Glycoside hydrolase n=1 Tax=Dechloromonas hankyongensis TaxID=2908002 RepID=A0ABS9JXL7_9RHOO|nr:sialidase family protein [Dechloromonas hankyongensis]MCG2575654.1 glycoside hydrolase [Dechloromonas hankyongensis]
MVSLSTRCAIWLAGALLAGSALAHDHGSHAPADGKPAAKVDYAKVWLEKQQTAPRLAVAADFDAVGKLWLARVVGQQIFVSHSPAAGKPFTEPVAVNRQPELISADGEARPQIAAVGDRVYVSWTQALPQPFAGHVRFAVSEDGGRTFSEPVTVNDDTRPITHRFNAMLADCRGVTLAWIDKRDGEGNVDYRGAAIYTARSTDGGRSFAANQKLADHSCECCRLGLAADSDGTPVVFWRQVFGKNVRDFALARLDEPLRRVTEDGWEIDACPHHGGGLAIDGQGSRHLAWFTGAEKSPGLYYRRIDGETMSPPLRFGNLDAQAGHPQVAVLGQQVVLVWREYDGRQHSVRQMVSRDRGGHWSSPSTITRTAGAADDPLLRADGKAVWLIWNTAAEGLKRVKVAL